MKILVRVGLACAALLLVVGHSLAGAGFHVATTGQASGSGSSSSPWDLRSALNQPSAVHPGDTIWVHGGTYVGTFSTNLNGTSSQPIVVRNWNNERVTIDGGNSNGAPMFVIGGSYTWYWGLEITSSTPNKISSQATSWPTDIMYGEGLSTKQGGTDGTGCKFINLVIHDTRQGMSSWKEAAGSEVYGCIVYDNGWIGSDRPHGHNFYIQNVSGTKLFSDNFILRAYSHNIQSYGSTASNEDNETFTGNVGINGGERNFMLGGDNVAHNPSFLNNVMYSDGARAGTNNFYLGYPTGYSPGTDSAVVTGNYFAGGTLTFNLDANMTFSGNTVFHTGLTGDVPSLAGNLVTTAPPQSDSIIIRPNKYEPARANLVVLNWTGLNAVDVDLSSVVRTGDPYIIRDAQNYYGAPVASGTYAGGKISVPMTGGTVPGTVGNDPRGVSHTGRECGTFVIFGSGAGVILPNVSGSLSVTPTSLPAGGGSVTLSWTSQNATSAAIDQGIGTVGTSGSRPVTVAATATFTLTLQGRGGPITSQATVQVAQAPLAGPVLATPQNGSSGLPTTIQLGWNATQGATGYELQLATDSSFSKLVYSNASVAGTTDQVSGLTNGLTYYWRVRGKNASGNGSYSVMWHFATIAPQGTGPGSLPLVLMGTPPESSSADVTVAKPPGAAKALLVLNVYDADSPNEGSLYINNTFAADLFGAQAASKNDARSALVTFALSPDLWNNGVNQLRFVHSQTAGYRIDNIGVSFSVSDTGGAGGFTVTRRSVPFGTVPLGSNKIDSVSVTNTGGVALVISGVTSSNGTFTVSPTNVTLQPAQARTFYITFTPANTTAQTGNVVFTHNASSSPDTVAVSGTGTLPGFALNRRTVPFGTVPLGSNRIDSVSVTNTGGVALVISGVTSSNGTFTVSPANVTLQPAQARTFYITFTPANALPQSGNIVFTHNPPAGTDTVSVSGTGGAGGFSVTRRSVPFGTVAVGSNKIDSVSVTNTGGVALVISGVTSSNGTFTVSPTNVTLQPAQARTFYITFTPANALPQSGNIVFTHNPPGGTDTVSVSGTGGAGGFSVTRRSVPFGTVPVGSNKIDSVSVTNTGGVALVISGVTSSNGTFTVSPANVTLQPAQARTFYITFTPADALPQSGNIVFMHNAPGGGTDTVSVSGTGGSTPTRSTTSFSLDQNFPNPFNPATTIRYTVAFPSKVTLTILNILGQTVAKLVDAVKPPGVYSVQFNASALASGIYYCQLVTESGIANVKMVLLR